MESNEGERTELEKLMDVFSQKYKQQAVWFLNSSKKTTDRNTCELVWTIHKTCVHFDENKEDGRVLDEITALRVLEVSEEACTTKELRQFLMKINPNYKRRVSLAELLIFKFDENWIDLVNAPQCYDWQAEKEAQEEFDKVKDSLHAAIEAQRKSMADADAAKLAEERAAHEEDESSKAAEASRVAEAASSEARDNAKTSLEALTLEEKSNSEKREKLEKAASDDTLGVVKRNKAKAELAVMLGGDTLPLRAARIQQEAALKKLTRATERAGKAAAASETATKKSQEAQVAARRAREEALATAKEAEAQIPYARQALDEIQKVLDKFHKNKKAGKGTIFYIERELEEAAKFLPKKKFMAAREEAENALMAASLQTIPVCH